MRWFSVRRVCRAALTIVLCSIFGCGVARVNDLRLASVEIMDRTRHIPPELSEWHPEGKLVKLSFTTQINVRDIAKQFGLHVGIDAYFCGNKKHELSGLGLVFDDEGLIGDRPRGSRRPDGRQISFYVAERSGPAKDETGTPSIPGYDLRKEPKDVCIRLRGHNMALEGFTSNIVTVPSEELERAFLQDR